MKHSYLARILTVALSVILCLMSLSILAVSAEETAEEAFAEEYEAKKAAYRAQLMADDVTSDDLLIGSWVSFYSFETDSYEYQLDQMAAAGINFNIFPRNFGSGAMYDAAYWEDVEAQYAKRNMVYIMNGSMAEGNIAIGVEYAAGKEHCIGYHIVDEPTADKFPEIGRLISLYRAADETRYPLVNLFPSYAPEWALGGTYYEHVSNYVTQAGAENIEYLSHDYYPFRAGGVVLTDIFGDMEVLRKVAYENGKLKTHAFPQSTAWNGTRMPTADEMRWNVYAYLAYGFKALSWFNLVCPGSSDTEGEGFNDSLIYRDGTIRNPELFAFWSELNWEVRGLSSVLMNLDTVHAYHVIKNVGGVEYLPEDYFLQPDGRNDFLVSHMESKDGDETYIMLFNKNTRRTASCDFTVDPDSGVKWLEYFDPFIGEYIPVELTDGSLEDSFKAGEGKLYRLRYDDPPVETEEPTEEPTEGPTEEPTEIPTQEVTEVPTEEVTEAPTETPTQEVTEAPTETPTEAPTAETATEAEPSKGCGSVMSGIGIPILLSALTAALCVRRRKDDPTA